jgi:hypothetical protein
MKKINKHKLIYRELYHKQDVKIVDDKKVENFKWEFVVTKKKKKTLSRDSKND